MVRAALAAFAAFVVACAAAGMGVVVSNDRAAGHVALFAKLEKTDVVREGAKNPESVLYVFFDANCYYCHLTWKALQPYEAAGLQVRWVPVAYQKPSSVGRAGAIMRAPDRVAALRANEAGYKAAQFDGGIAPIENVPAALAAMFEANTELMRQFGAPGTPALVWKDRAGEVRFTVGVPRLSELPRITGLPAQANDDPELAGFR